MFGKRDKKAVFYYSRVVEGWASVGNILLEPVTVEGQESLGKTPQFCCAALEKVVGRPSGTFQSIDIVYSGLIYLTPACYDSTGAA